MVHYALGGWYHTRSSACYLPAWHDAVACGARSHAVQTPGMPLGWMQAAREAALAAQAEEEGHIAIDPEASAEDAESTNLLRRLACVERAGFLHVRACVCTHVRRHTQPALTGWDASRLVWLAWTLQVMREVAAEVAAGKAWDALPEICMEEVRPAIQRYNMFMHAPRPAQVSKQHCNR